MSEGRKTDGDQRRVEQQSPHHGSSTNVRSRNVLRVRERYEIEQPVWGLGHRPKKVNRHECDQHALRDGGEPRHKTVQETTVIATSIQMAGSCTAPTRKNAAISPAISSAAMP